MKWKKVLALSFLTLLLSCEKEKVQLETQNIESSENISYSDLPNDFRNQVESFLTEKFESKAEKIIANSIDPIQEDTPAPTLDLTVLNDLTAQRITTDSGQQNYVLFTESVSLDPFQDECNNNDEEGFTQNVAGGNVIAFTSNFSVGTIVDPNSTVTGFSSLANIHRSTSLSSFGSTGGSCNCSGSSGPGGGSSNNSSNNGSFISRIWRWAVDSINDLFRCQCTAGKSLSSTSQSASFDPYDYPLPLQDLTPEIEERLERDLEILLENYPEQFSNKQLSAKVVSLVIPELPTNDCDDPKTWFKDVDGDGYHSAIVIQKESPIPESEWKLSSSGEDCDDDDPTKTLICDNKRPYIPQENDKFLKDDLPTTLDDAQFLNTCVSTGMEYVADVLGGRLKRKKVEKKYEEQFGIHLVLFGVDYEHMNVLASNYFNTDGFMTTKEAIDAGNIMMTNLNAGTDENGNIVYHNVVIVGYHENGDYIYMDPVYGSFWEASPSFFPKNYVINIKSLK